MKNNTNEVIGFGATVFALLAACVAAAFLPETTVPVTDPAPKKAPVPEKKKEEKKEEKKSDPYRPGYFYPFYIPTTYSECMAYLYSDDCEISNCYISDIVRAIKKNEESSYYDMVLAILKSNRVSSCWKSYRIMELSR